MLKFCLSTSIILSLVLTLSFANAERVENVENEDPETRSITGDSNWDKVVTAFRETVIRGLLQADALKLTASPLLMGHPLGIATIWILTMIQIASGGGDSEWDKMEEKLDRKISATLNDDYLSSLTDDWNHINLRLFKAKEGKFELEDLSYVRAEAPKFFPQQKPRAKFTVKWTNQLVKYLAVLNAIYIDFMGNDRIDKCAWANELKNLRPYVLMAGRKLAKARYRDLEKTDWHGGVTIFTPWARLTYTDTSTGDVYSKVPLKSVKSEVFDKLVEDTRNFLMDNLINKFNLLFNETWTPSRCKPPAEINESDLDISFPQSCMDSAGECTFPCGYYTEDTKWCPKWPNHVVTSNGYWDTTRHGRLTSSGQKYFIENCNYPDWDKCMKTTRVPLIEWKQADIDLKKKAKKKGKKATKIN